MELIDTNKANKNFQDFFLVYLGGKCDKMVGKYNFYPKKNHN
jgi:hypothetical protein